MALQLDQLSFSYGENPVLKNLSGEIRTGEFLCVAGPSGSGKTTLLRLLAGLEVPGSGSLRIDGQPVSGPGRDRAVMFQQDPLFSWMTVEKNVAFAKSCPQGSHKKGALQQARTLLAQVGLAGEEKKFPCQLSGGMRQRVAFARAIAMESSVLLLDEPFGALDPGTRQEMVQLLLDLWKTRGMTVVMVTHDLREAVTVADRIWILRSGVLERDLPMELPREHRDAAGLEQELKSRFFGQTEETL